MEEKKLFFSPLMTVARSFFGAPKGLSLTVAMFSMYLARFLTLDMSWYPPRMTTASRRSFMADLRCSGPPGQDCCLLYDLMTWMRACTLQSQPARLLWFFNAMLTKDTTRDRVELAGTF